MVFKWWRIVGMGARQPSHPLARAAAAGPREPYPRPTFAIIIGLNARIGKGVSHGFD
jgi:hypothetical protein